MKTLRLAAILLPTALVLHEGAYALAGGGLIGGAHGYLELAIPLAATLAASLALAAVLLPVLSGRRDEGDHLAPFAIAAGLASIFAVQELAEAVLLGGGWDGFAASLAVSWLVPPLALLLGALASVGVVSLARAGDRLADLLGSGDELNAERVGTAWNPARQPYVPAAACAGLSFGASRRPPPARA